MNKKSGFTLAEIIITLTIIGVVAAMTIPNMMQDIQDKQYKVATKKVYAEMSGIIRQMVRDKVTLSGYFGNPNSFKPDFIKYFNVIKDCGDDDCVPQSVSSDIYKSLSGKRADTNYGGEGQFVTSNGMFISIQNTDMFNKGIMIIVDVNGYIKGPNIFGKDTFFFQIVNDALLPMGADGTYVSAAAYCQKTGDAIQGAGCTLNVMTDRGY